MSIQNGTRIVSPINLQEPYTVMGVSKTGTYYDVGYICSNSHGRINKWARNKPIRVNQPGEITDAQKHSASFGLSATFSASANAVWNYLPPRPGTDWCRLTDFVGYDHGSACGLAFKAGSYTKDLFNDKTSLVVALQDNANLITAYDLRDTVFAGMRFRLHMTFYEGAGQAYDAYSNIDKQSITFTIPYDQLLMRGAGEYNLTLYGVTSGNETRRIFLPENETIKLYMTNDTGLSIPYWDSTQFLDEDGNYYLIGEYEAGHGDNTLNITDSNLSFRQIIINNNNGRNISNSNIYVQFEWDVSNGTSIKRVPLVDLDNTGGSWDTRGSISIQNAGCYNSQLPQLTTSAQVNQYTRVSIVYKHTDNNYYGISKKKVLRIKRDNGTAPDFTNPN